MHQGGLLGEGNILTGGLNLPEAELLGAWVRYAGDVQLLGAAQMSTKWGDRQGQIHRQPCAQLLQSRALGAHRSGKTVGEWI